MGVGRWSCPRFLELAAFTAQVLDEGGLGHFDQKLAQVVHLNGALAVVESLLAPPKAGGRRSRCALR
jgi:hypothetical protein